MSRSRSLAAALVSVVVVVGCRTGAPPTPPMTAPAYGYDPRSGEELPDPSGGGAPASPSSLPTTAEPPANISPSAPELGWWRASMTGRAERLAWWREARFGMFVHWGVYSGLGGVWEGQPVKGYAEHIQRIRKIPRAVYLERVAAQFLPLSFDADKWMAAAKDAGMGYFVITAKHHDGFAMYDSAVSDYNIVKATPWRRDPMRALADAARRHGVKFGFYYSHAFDWGEAIGFGNDWEHQNPGGDRLLHGRDWWLTAPQFLPQARRYVDGKAIPQLRELIANYDPDILWFDTPHKLPPQENLRILQAVRAAKPNIVVNSRIMQALPNAPPERYGDYASTADRPAEFPPQAGDWEGIPTTNESYGWHQEDSSHKPPGFFVELLAKAAARGGNVLLNIGPRGDGRIDAPDVKILDGLATWMKANRASIVGTTRTPLAVQAWGESTVRGNTVYLHVLRWPQRGPLVVGGLHGPLQAAYLLADPKRKPLQVTPLAPLDLAITVPARAPDPIDTVIAVEFAAKPVTDTRRLLSSAVAEDVLRAFDGEPSAGLDFGAGKVRDAWVHGWTKTGQHLDWKVRLREPARFAVSVSYDAEVESTGGRFEVTLGDQRVTGVVAPTPAAPVRLGEVTLPAGSFDVTVRSLAVAGKELFRLRSVVLTPVRAAAQAAAATP